MVLPAATQAWDFWAVLVNFVRGPLACGPGVPREHHETCTKCAGPLQQDYCSCKALCNMYDSSSSSRFYNDRAKDFCDRMDEIKARASYTSDDYSCTSTSSYGGQTNIQQSSASSASSASAASEADGYAGQSSGGVGVVGDMARTFQWWMAGVAAAVVMALVAVVMGQRKDKREDTSGSGGRGENDRAVLSGAVGRRLGAVAAFAEGVLPTRNKNNRNSTKEQVTEMSGYKLDTSDGGGGGGSIHSGSDEENGSLGGYESAYA